ncbi:MAG: amylo-alpha-1,6-glucosidase [Chloroflexota bacterium]
MRTRTALLGDEGGFILHLPATLNTGDRTTLSSKWFGASGFGRHYLSNVLLWAVIDGKEIALNRTNQQDFTQFLDYAERSYLVENHVIRQRFFVPSRLQAIVISLECDSQVGFIAEPEFDMRYYQAFNTDFTAYAAEIVHGDCLHVSNCVTRGAGSADLEFFGVIRAMRAGLAIELLPERQRLRHKTYLVDEHRHELILSAYQQTQSQSPDEAPIWDCYATKNYAPARLRMQNQGELIFGFDSSLPAAERAVTRVQRSLSKLRSEKRDETEKRQAQGSFRTGDTPVDDAYAQVLARFNDCLVARDMVIESAPHAAAQAKPASASQAGSIPKAAGFNAIFAGNKYFLDPWKRDENISLGALLVTGEYETVRAVLGDTWRFQDQRTGRLPHIIRLGEPLVYYSSDGTLWALRRLYEYTRMSGDTSLLDDKYRMVEHFFKASLRFAKRGLLPSGGIIDPSYRWETWEDTPYTPRDGYPVEIELLWLTAIQDYLPTVRQRNPKLASRLETVLQDGRSTFESFYLDGYLADSLTYDWKPRTILTPNGYIAFGLDYPIPPDLAGGMVTLAREQLAGKIGVRSLAPRDWSSTLSAAFLADPQLVHGDSMASVGLYNYHRGIEWLWFNPCMVKGELRYGDADQAFHRYLSGQVRAALHLGGAGGLSELCDMHGPLGADYQAWSMAGFIEALHAFAMVDVDAIDRVVSVRPSMPSTWNDVSVRKQVGGTRFDVNYRRSSTSRTIEIRPVDTIPHGYQMRVGACLTQDAAQLDVRWNGHPVPPDQVEMHRVHPGSPREAWVHGEFSGEMVVSFDRPG